jgi:hypothetical protein
MKFFPLLLLSALSSPAAVLYSESFTHAGGGGEVTTSTVQWASYYSSTAQPIASSTATPRMAIGNQQGSDAGPGYLFSQGAGTGTTHPYAGFESTAFSILPTDITTITFTQGNSATSLATRIMVQQNGNWYATNLTFGTAAMGLAAFQTGSAELETFNFTLTASAWHSVTINPNIALSVAGATIASDLSSTAPITSIGFYTTSDSGVTRIDEVKINGIPEPSFAMLLGAGTMLAFRRRNRR